MYKRNYSTVPLMTARGQRCHISKMTCSVSLCMTDSFNIDHLALYLFCIPLFFPEAEGSSAQPPGLGLVQTDHLSLQVTCCRHTSIRAGDACMVSGFSAKFSPCVELVHL